MGVDQPRHQYASASVNDCGVGWSLNGLVDLGDLVAFDEHAHASRERFALAVEYVRVGNENLRLAVFHSLFLSVLETVFCLVNPVLVESLVAYFHTCLKTR